MIDKKLPDAYLFGIPLYKVEVPLYYMPKNIEFNLKDAQEKRAELFKSMTKRMEKFMNIDQKIEFVKLIQRIFDNCSESEHCVGTNGDGDDRYESNFSLSDVRWAINKTIEDLVNEKLRDVDY
jgi:hypothetical protein